MRRSFSPVLVLALCALSAGGPSCGHSPLQGAGPVVTAPLSVAPAGDYREIRADGAFRLVVRSGDRRSVTVEAEENLVPLFEAKLEGGVLVLSADRPYSSPQGVTVTVSGPAVAALRVGGAVRAEADLVEGDAAVVSAAGASHVTVAHVAARSVRALATGASHVDLAGSGVESFDAKASGASKVAARVACGTAKLTAEGASGIEGVSAKRATAIVAGASSIDLDCAEHLQADATGSSKVTYGGEPKVEGTVGKVAVVAPRGRQ